MFRKTLTFRCQAFTKYICKTTNIVYQRQPNLKYSILRHSSQNQVFSPQLPKLQICHEQKMSSDQSEIKFEDADLYERFMGVWSKMVGSKFIEWMSPETGKSWVDIGKSNFQFKISPLGGNHFIVTRISVFPTYVGCPL